VPSVATILSAVVENLDNGLLAATGETLKAWGFGMLITIGIGVAFGSVRAAAAAVLPNAIPLVLGYAIIAASVGRFDPLGGIVLAVALGIAVDDTIHLIGRTAEMGRTGVPLERALDEAVARSGFACAVTSLVLACGLALFALSSFPPLRLLGVLGATVIVVALLCDLFVLPAVLVLLRRRPVR
jgi:predicted RND superfamily exporter protein